MLRPLPVEALRLSSEVVELLHQLGVRQIAQIERLPRAELCSRFGPELLRQWDRAIGQVAEPVPTHRPAPEFQAEWTAEAPTARREAIEAVLERLVAQLAAMAVRQGRGILRIKCRLRCVTEHAQSSTGILPMTLLPSRCPESGDESPHSKGLAPLRLSVGLFEPSGSVRHLVELLQMQLERTRLPGPVAGVEVAAAATAPLVRRQQDLFSRGDGSCQPSSRQLAALVDRLSSRLGYRAVVRARLLADAQPELAWCYRPMIDDARRRRARKELRADLLPRPLRLLPRPMALNGEKGDSPHLPERPGGCFAQMGTVLFFPPDGPPLRFQLGRREHRIARTWGPERIETGWWRGRAVGRDYYRIETTSGRRFWLFRRLRDGRWFVHGMFE